VAGRKPFEYECTPRSTRFHCFLDHELDWLVNNDGAGIRQLCVTMCRAGSWQNLVRTLKLTGFWHVAPRSLVEVDRRFRGVYCLYHHDALMMGAETCHLHTRRREKLKPHTVLSALYFQTRALVGLTRHATQTSFLSVKASREVSRKNHRSV
jgi:hypothetical protein